MNHVKKALLRKRKLFEKKFTRDFNLQTDSYAKKQALIFFKAEEKLLNS